MKALKYWLGFNMVKGIGPAKLKTLLDYYKSPEAAWFVPEPIGSMPIITLSRNWNVCKLRTLKY